MSPPLAKLAPERGASHDAALDRFLDSLVERVNSRDRTLVDQVCRRLDTLLSEAKAIQKRA